MVLGLPDLVGQVLRRELRVTERGIQREGKVQVGADADLQGPAAQPVVQDVAAALALSVEEMHVTAGHSDALFVERGAEPGYGSGDVSNWTTGSPLVASRSGGYGLVCRAAVRVRTQSNSPVMRIAYR